MNLNDLSELHELDKTNEFCDILHSRYLQSTPWFNSKRHILLHTCNHYAKCSNTSHLIIIFERIDSNKTLNVYLLRESLFIYF